jgi:hypothetical protein
MHPHLLVEISAHGFGHLAQTAPIINALFRRFADLQLTVRGGLSEAVLRARLTAPFRWLPHDADIGMRMASALTVRIRASQSAYRAFHADWTDKVARETRVLQELAPDLILSNIPYLVLAAAARAQIPTVALSSLNWAAIYHHYCGHLPGAEVIHGQIVSAYRTVQSFLRIEPGLPMPNLEQCRRVGPIAAHGRDRRGELCQVLQVDPAERLVLVALGGVDTTLPLDQWPITPGVQWLAPNGWGARRADIKALQDLSMPFLDVLASSDAVLTKPGYGTFVEAACNGIPVLSIKRPDWPETPHLNHWLQTHGILVEIDPQQISAGAIAQPLANVLSRPRPARVIPSGVEEAAQLLASMLSP